MGTHPVTSRIKMPGGNALKLLEVPSGTDRIAFAAVDPDALTLSCRILCKNISYIRNMKAVH